MTADPWPTVELLTDWVGANPGHSGHQEAMRLMKVTEEAGEAVAAYIGMTGQNRRKGRTHLAADVADELCDVILAAMVALYDYAASPADHFTARLAHVADRAGVAGAVGAGPAV